MGNAKYIGRVGALAVALGIGMATAGSPGVADAEPSSPDSGTSADTSASPTSGTPAGETTGSSPDTTDATSSEEQNRPTGTVSASGGAEVDSSAERQEQAADEDEIADDTSVADAAITAPDPPDTEADTHDPVAPPDASSRDTFTSPPKPRGDAARASITTEQTRPTPADAPSITASSFASQATDVHVAAVQRSTPASDAASPKPSNVVVTQTVTIATSNGSAPTLGVVSGLASGLLGLVGLGPAATGTPAAPAEPPFLWAVLAWVRRQVQQTLFNRTPTAAPEQPVTPTAGVVTGSINAFDADDDPLQYVVTRAPANGTVVVNSDGTYVYTPGAGPPADDSFEVKVMDVGFHLHLGNLIAPDFGRSYIVTVPVDVSEAVVGTRIPVGDQPSTIEVRSDGARAYVLHGPSSRVSVIDTATDTVVATIPVGDAGWTSRGLALRPDGTQAYVITQRPDGVGFLAVIDTATNTVTKTILLGNNTFNGVAVDANGVIYVVARGTSPSSPGIVGTVDVVTGMVTPLAAVGREPQFVAVKPGGSQLYVTNFDDDTVSVVSGNTVVTTIPVGDGADGIAFSSNGARAYVTNFNAGTVSVIDTTTNSVIKTIAVGANPVGLTVSPDGTAIYVATFGSGKVTVIDTASLTVVEDIPVTDGPADVAFRPDGQRAYVTRNIDDSVSVITLD